jgi:hypothetical protein
MITQVSKIVPNQHEFTSKNDGPTSIRGVYCIILVTSAMSLIPQTRGLRYNGHEYFFDKFPWCHWCHEMNSVHVAIHKANSVSAVSLQTCCRCDEHAHEYCFSLYFLLSMDKMQPFKGNVQRKQTGAKSGINRKLMIPCIPAGYFFKFKGPCPFKFKIKFFWGGGGYTCTKWEGAYLLFLKLPFLREF